MAEAKTTPPGRCDGDLQRAPAHRHHDDARRDRPNQFDRLARIGAGVKRDRGDAAAQIGGPGPHDPVAVARQAAVAAGQQDEPGAGLAGRLVQ
jgi:hypothetical protein